MTDTTPLDVATAQQRLDDALTAEREAQDRLLVAIASGFGDAAEQQARQVTRDQPERAHALGREGIARMRAELAAVAETLADELVRSRAHIAWPEEQREWSRAGVSPVDSAIYNFLYGYRVDQLAEVLGRYGFEVSKTSDGPSARISAFLPQYLYSRNERRDDFAAVSKASVNVAAARAALRRAEKEQSKASVDDLWD